MNFFELQDQARQRTRWLVVLFVLAVIAIVLAINVVFIAVMFGVDGIDQLQWQQIKGLVYLVTGGTLATIAIASLSRSAQLRAGGGARVASELGGVLVDPQTTDPDRRRLLNVVEEMAIASGIPVPQVFVLEQETGINAFAAGWSPSDAVVAVTRGALETLSRDELQGVIAHEFSHVFNGDMRLNIRLIGLLFGILAIAVIGREMLSSVRFSGRRRGRDAVAFLTLGLAVMLIGYVGFFFGRWIQAAVSRQREYLADASAVQFTRYPDGLAGALKKIGASSTGSTLQASTDEVAHMLFAQGFVGRLMATHPPLQDRIRRLDPDFDPAELRRLAEQMQRAREAESQAAAAEAATGRARATMPLGLDMDADALIDRIGEPGMPEMLAVAALLASMPAGLADLARSDRWAEAVALRLLLADDPELREQQLLAIAQARGAETEQQVRELLAMAPKIERRHRLPLLELCFPALRRQPTQELLALLRLSEQLAGMDHRIDVFEFVYSRLLGLQIEQLLQPEAETWAGSRTLSACADAAADLLWVLALAGHPDDPEAARAAYEQARKHIDGLPQRAAGLDDLVPVLDRALTALSALRQADRAVLLEAMLACIRHDGRTDHAEYELLRLVAAQLGVPLPMIPAPDAAGGQRTG